MKKEEKELLAAILEVTEASDNDVTRQNNVNNIH
jgi:hypothetical protein